ncbi:hypothetical protein OIB37_11085 [Streptomyces sp. NBC_00820]|uniref:hypothetical protein n=1 Tax=Streptomyces sp. NBC_00820 TaxID=2975842 RepID=UPI002ED0A60A|nr:hypothetical protein OIB37_11085 [Streptomyces sp. NBC_00820]
MHDTPTSDAVALRAMASAFEAQRGQLPVPEDPHRAPDLVAVAMQIGELGKLITELGDEVLFRAADQDQSVRTDRVSSSFAAAVRPAGEAASALGDVAAQLSFLDATKHLRDQPDARDARQAAARVIDEALDTATTVLREAADSLHAASATVSPPAIRAQTARRRSTAPVPAAGSLPQPGTPAAPAQPGRIARGQ